MQMDIALRSGDIPRDSLLSRDFFKGNLGCLFFFLEHGSPISKLSSADVQKPFLFKSEVELVTRKCGNSSGL